MSKLSSWAMQLCCYMMAVCVQASVDSIECFACLSSIDPGCANDPGSTVICNTENSHGCATWITDDGEVQKGCSDMGLFPSGCQISSFFGVQCICHSNRCNKGLPDGRQLPYSNDALLQCYACDSETDSDCGEDLHTSIIPLVTCPQRNGCYLSKRHIGEELVYSRLCYEAQAPATYFPAGCYRVYNEELHTHFEVCVCYTDRCNINTSHMAATQHITSSEFGIDANGSVTFWCISLVMTIVIS